MEGLLTISEYSKDELADVASKVVELLPDSGIVAFQGEMGVGKTTLIKFICAELGVKDAVTSPTFSVVNVYESDETSIYHIDLYRLKNEREVESAGVFEILNSDGLSFVEWPERIADELWHGVWVLHIELCEKFNLEGMRRLDLQRP